MEWHCSDQHTTYLNSTPTETQAHTNIANSSTTLCFSNFLTLSPTPASWTFFSATALLSWTSSCWIYIWSPGLYIHTRKKSLVWFILNRANPRTQNAKEYLPNVSCMCSTSCPGSPRSKKSIALPSARTYSRSAACTAVAPPCTALGGPPCTGWGGARPAGVPATHARHLLL